MYFHEKKTKKKSNILKLIKKNLYILKLFNFYIDKKK